MRKGGVRFIVFGEAQYDLINFYYLQLTWATHINFNKKNE